MGLTVRRCLPRVPRKSPQGPAPYLARTLTGFHSESSAVRSAQPGSSFAQDFHAVPVATRTGGPRSNSTWKTQSNPAGPKPILDDLDLAVRFGEQLDCPLWLGEFGAYGKADMDSRVRWTTFVREEAEKRGIPWAYWEFGAGFGIYDRSAEAFRQELTAALIPLE